MFIFSSKILHAIDSKDRVQIPAYHRNQLALKLPETTVAKDGLFFHVTYTDKEKCIYVYPQMLFEQQMEKLDEECSSIFAPLEKVERYRSVTANTQLCRCDQQGRIIVPKSHFEHAGIEKEVLIVGVGSRLEFWKPENFEKSGKKV